MACRQRNKAHPDYLRHLGKRILLSKFLKQIGDGDPQRGARLLDRFIEIAHQKDSLIRWEKAAGAINKVLLVQVVCSGGQ